MLIKQQFVLSRLNTYGGGNPCRFITIHETGNFSLGADAQAHANLQSRGYSATWHYQVDDEQIIQSFPDEVRCWHAGDGRGKGNRESIAIEICVHPDGNFIKAVKNAVHLVAILMNKHGIPIGNVVQHHHWSKKNCPQLLRAGSRGVTWTDFIKMVKRKLATGRLPQTYKVNKVLNGYYTANDAKRRVDKRTKVQPGIYHIFKEHGGMLNVTRMEGVPGSWINPEDN
ncbi:N-acetylmuramoyl-L-alanine amidase family protein [Lederbergia graminis]|uniref:N-acetylmuramoyl-L-alanine amidase n=1 Tax=Lederbergia graminis TaxID=735518 RepID=A0ABW0LLZ6_9BACI